MADSLSSKELDDIATALGEAEQESMSVCPEDVFKELYLPVFSGQVINDRAVNAWIYMAGGVSKRVKVIDGNGNVLFVVPAWYSTHHMRIDAPKDTSIPSFSEIVAQAMMCVNHSPMRAVAAFQEATLTHLTKNIDKTSDNALHGEWEKIFARYGITPQVIMQNFKARIESQKEDATNVTTAANTAVQDETLGDDFIAEE